MNGAFHALLVGPSAVRVMGVARVARVTHVMEADYRVGYGEPDSSLEDLQEPWLGEWLSCGRQDEQAVRAVHCPARRAPRARP